MKKTMSLILLFIMVFSLLTTTITANAAEVMVSGQCGTNVNYTLYDDGKLVISGTGHMRNDRVVMNNYSHLVKSVVIERGITNIGSGAFYNYSNLTSVEIPYGVKVIGYNSFNGCFSLKSITIPNSVTYIDGWAFYNCSNLTSVKIGNSVTDIYEAAFADCTSLKSVEIPESVTSIDISTFSGCDSLTAINIDENNSVYSSIDGVVFNKDKTCLYLYPKGKVDATYIIPDNVTSIGEFSLYGCDNLINVKIPDGVTSIGEYAFEWCTNLTSIEIPDSVTVIDTSPFSYCLDLTDVYYTGTEEQWNKITINGSRLYLDNATIHFESSLDIPERLLGDVNGDGVVNITDATNIQKYAVSRVTLFESQLIFADFNEDGIVDVSDATDIQKYIVNN